MSLVSVILSIFILFSGATATAPTVPATVSQDAQAAWESYDAVGLSPVSADHTLAVTYVRTVDGNHEYTTAPTEFPVWDLGNPTMVHIFRVDMLHYA